MINGLDIYYSKSIGRGLKPISTNNNNINNNNNQQTISSKGRGLKPISIGKGCIKGKGLKILQ